MAAGTISVSPVGQGVGAPDAFKIIGAKVKKAKDQAIEARQEADEKIKKIEETPEEDLTQEDIVELESLKQKRSENGYFFKKALKFQATDKIRTTMGKFQRDPELQNDPAATEKERFYAKSGMFRPGEMPDMSNREGKDKDVLSYVGKGFQMIMDAIDKVKSKVNRTAESSEKTSRTASSTESTTENVSKSTENLSNSTENIANTSKSEVNVQQMEFNFEQDAENKREQAAAEARSEGQSDVAGTSDVIETDQGVKKRGGGLFSSLLDIGGNLARRGRFGRRIGNRMPGAGRARLGRMRAGRMMNPARRNTQYTAPIGPQPMNSPTPWASEGGGFTPRMESSTINMSQGGIIAPIKPKKQQKLADGGITGLVSKFLPPPIAMMMNMMLNPGGAMGGIGSAIGGVGKAAAGAAGGAFQMLTNPTKLIGDGLRAVLPMNRGVGKDMMKGGKGETENISKMFQMMPVIGGGMLFASMAQVANAIPFMGAIINAAKPILKPLIEAFGLPASVLGMIIGGAPASAATMQQPKEEEDPNDDPGEEDPDDSGSSPGAPLTGGTAQFGSLSGTSGTVAYGGKESTTLGAEYSPFSKADIKSKGISISSGKGYRRSTNSNHQGYDVGAPNGTPLYAYLPGKISRKLINGKDDGGYGNGIEWKDSVYNQKHFFGHMQSPSPFRVGQSVNQGDMLGMVGGTGNGRSNAYADHLHWEIGGQGSTLDPGMWVKNHPLVPQSRPTPAAPTGIAASPGGAAPTPSAKPRTGGGSRAGGSRAGGSSPGGLQASAANTPSSNAKQQQRTPTESPIAYAAGPGGALDNGGLWNSPWNV